MSDDLRSVRSVARLQLVSAQRMDGLESLRTAIAETIRELADLENEGFDKLMLRMASDFLAGRFDNIAVKRLDLIIERVSECGNSARALNDAENSVHRLEEELDRRTRLLSNIISRD